MWTSVCLLLLAGIFSSTLCLSPALQEFSIGNRQFSAAVYQTLSNEEPANFLVSPLSVSTVMALAALGANGRTFQEMSRGLQLHSNKQSFINMFSELTPLLRGSPFYTLSSANRLFVQQDFQINKTFENLAEHVFDSGVTNLNFGLSNQAATTINQWVEQKTNDKIHKLVTPDDLSAGTRMLLVNALYFKGKWMKPFDAYDTTKVPFFPMSGNQVNIDMMHTVDSFNYYENPELDCKFLEMYYEGGEVSMVFVLPNNKDGFRQLEQRMFEVLTPQPYKKQQVRVVIPLFAMETSVQFKPILEKLGIRRVFTPEADLSGIGSHQNNLYIDKVIQKTFINVTEKGTEAAAATAGGVVTLSIPPPEKTVQASFVADHPFIMYIQLNSMERRPASKASTILFTGRFIGPKY